MGYVGSLANIEARRMHDDWGYSRTRSTTALVIGGMALALVALLGAATVYLAMRVAVLDKETARLRSAQVELKDTLQALASSPPANQSAPAATVPAAPSTPDAPASPPAPPANAATAPAANASPEPAGPTGSNAPAAQPAPASDTYSVRIFASASTSNKNKLDRFVNAVRSLGFNVDVSENSITDSTNSAILYHPSALNTANRLAASLKQRYPSLNFEMKASPAINDNLKRVLIVSLNQDAIN